jgi:hypothetical protein
MSASAIIVKILQTGQPNAANALTASSRKIALITL